MFSQFDLFHAPSENILPHCAHTTVPAVVNFEYLIICVNFRLTFKRIIKKIAKLQILNIWHLLQRSSFYFLQDKTKEYLS